MMHTLHDSEELKKWVTVSFVLHLLFFSALLWSSKGKISNRSYYAPVYRANLVTMSKKQEIAEAPKAESSPAAVSPPAPPPAAKKEAVEKKALVPEKKAVPVKTAKPVKAEAKPAKKEKVNPDAAIAALSEKVRVEKEIEQVKASVNARETKATASGARASKGVEKQAASAAGLSSPEAQRQLQSYKDLLAERIGSNWRLPGLKDYRGLEVIAVMTIGRAGELKSLRYEQRSVNGFYNTSVELAIKKSAPFPPLPEGAPTTMEFGVRFKDDSIVK